MTLDQKARLDLLRAQLTLSDETLETLRRKIESLEVSCATVLRTNPSAAAHPSYLEIQKIIASNRKELLRLAATNIEIRSMMLAIEQHLAGLAGVA